MRLSILTIMGVLFCSFSFGQSADSISLNLSDNGVFFGTSKIPDSVKFDYFLGKIGKPDRSKNDKGFVHVIYDELGIELTYRKRTKEVTAVSYSFQSILKSDPKKMFSGNFYVNGIPISKGDTPESIHKKLPSFTFESILSLSIYANKEIKFFTSSIPRQSINSIGCNFNTQN